MNNVTLIGRLTKDPEIRWTDGGLAIAQFSLAIDRPPNKNGEKQTDYPRVKAFGKTAEIIERYVAKGNQLGVTGRIQTGSYEKDGQRVYTTDVVADRIDLIGGSQTNAQNNNGNTSQSTWEQLDEDIPF